MILVCFILGKVAIQKEDLQKYHNRDTWFQLQHVDADSEVQVRWLKIYPGKAVFVTRPWQFHGFHSSRTDVLLAYRKEALPISMIWVLVITVGWITSVHKSLGVRILPTEIIKTM